MRTSVEVERELKRMAMVDASIEADVLVQDAVEAVAAVAAVVAVVEVSLPIPISFEAL